LVSVDKNNALKVKRAEGAYDKDLLGVVSTAPGVLLGTPEDYPISVKVTLAGRVPVKVSTENGAIEIGDYLTSSSTPGVAMKATDSGITIGKALEPFDSAQGEIGQIEVFINLGWYGGEVKLGSDGGVEEKVTTESSLVPADFLTNLVNGLAELGVSIKDGVITAVKLVVEEVKTKVLRANVISIQVEEGKDNVVGTATIPRDSMEYRVENSLVQANSKIFVSFTSNTAGRTWYVSEKTPGVGFTIKLSDVTTQPLDFDYWIVLVEGNMSPDGDEISSPAANETNSPSANEIYQPSADEISSPSENEINGNSESEQISIPSEQTASQSEPIVESSTEITASESEPIVEQPIEETPPASSSAQ